MSQRLLACVGWLTSFLSSSVMLSAQQLPYSAVQRQQIDQLRQTFQKTYDIKYSQAIALANLLRHPLEIKLPNRGVMVLQGLDDQGNLLYAKTTSTTQAGISTRTSSLYTGGSLGLNLSGSSASVKDRLGYWEVGTPTLTHIEYRGRVTQPDNATNTRGSDAELHANHVAGILIGAGINPQVRGMAYGANLKSYTSSNDLAEMTTASTNLLVSNHSWGYNAGWVYTGGTDKITWSWYGDTTISQTDDYKFGFYDSRSQSYDQIAVNAPTYLSVWSASNDHYASPAAGTSHYLANYNNTVSTKTRNDQRGYDQIPFGAQIAKNTLTVAAAGILKTDYTQPSDVQLTYFSSWGPTDDGRIKPDITGIGLSLLSCSNVSDSSYTLESGTSMSSPNVAGSLLLLQEYYAQLTTGKFMRASTLKGIVLHTAEETGVAPGPDYRFGWGLLNTERAARLIGNSDKTNMLDERTLNQGETYSLPMTASGKGSLRVTICWTDPAATPLAVSKTALNNRTPKLVNDLDIRVTNGTQTSLPWILDPDQPTKAATQGDNIRDNVEQVLISNPIPGQTYTLTVSHKGTLRNTKQDYALIISGVGGMTYCASGATTSADSKISRVQFGTVNKAGADGCTTYTDNLATVLDVSAGQTVPLSVTTGSCGTARTTILKAFVDWNQDGDFDDANETIATSGGLATGSTFTTNVVIPTTLPNDQFTRLRLVLVATEEPGAVTSCGTYAVGETQEFTLHYIRPVNDVGVTALITPGTGFCSPPTGGGLSIGVRVRNFGSVAQKNIPVRVQVTDAANTEITSLTGNIASLGAYSETLLALRTLPSVQLTPGQTYKFVVSTLLATDQVTTNDQLTEQRITQAAPTNTGLFAAMKCGSDTLISLTNSGAGTAYWYTSAVGGSLVAVGNRTSAPNLPTYYATLNDFAGRLGPVSKQEFGGGSYGGAFGPEPLLSVKAPLVIESARLYIGTPGRIQFAVKKLDGTVVSSVDLDVSTTRTLPTSATIAGGLADDPNDQGAEYPLNLTIPAAGDYKISLAYNLTPGYYTLSPSGDTLRSGDGVTIFRSNSAVSGFPFSIPGVISTKGSLFANTTTGKTDTLTTAWYYFYNMQIRSLDCPGLQRTPVTPTTGTAATATITPNGSASVCQGSSLALQANTGTGLSYQWYKDGQVITGAVSSTLQASTAGSYLVQVANTCSPVRSSAVAVSVSTPQNPVVTANGFTLSSNAVSTIQWLLDGVPIPGATGPTYSVIKSGRYSVQGNVNGCGVAISNEVVLTILATEPTTGDDDLVVYPNPATKQLTVSIAITSLLPQPPSLRLTNLQGQTVRTATLQRDGKNYSTVLDISDLAGGTFFVVVEDDRTQNVRVKRIRKY